MSAWTREALTLSEVMTGPGQNNIFLPIIFYPPFKYFSDLSTNANLEFILDKYTIIL
jgi:hypothetical protein